LLSLSLLGKVTLILAVFLALSILIYDAIHKIFSFSPVLMAICRLFLILLFWMMAAFLTPLCLQAQPGSLDSSFDPGTGVDQSVFAIAIQPDGRIIIAGDFTTMRGTPRKGIARLNSNGTLDTTFSASADTSPNALALQGDGRILIGGAFSTINGQPRAHIACLNTNGALDTNFLTTTDGNVDSFAVQPDGKVLIAGNFNTVNGQPRHHIARLAPNGSLDANFQNGMAGADPYVGCVAYDPSGKVLIGGPFWAVNGVPRVFIARLNVDGSLDSSFQLASKHEDRGHLPVGVVRI